MLSALQMLRGEAFPPSCMSTWVRQRVRKLSHFWCHRLLPAQYTLPLLVPTQQIAMQLHMKQGADRAASTQACPNRSPVREQLRI